MSNSQTISSALDALAHLRQYDNFQEIAFQLAKAHWPRLHLTHKVHDRGADAIDETEKIVLACGWNGKLDKLKQDLDTIRSERPEYRRIVFATSLTVSEAKQEEWRKAIQALGFELVSVIHRDRIIGELERPENVWIAHRYLELPIGNFADMWTHLPRVREAAYRIHAFWRVQYSLQGVPSLDIRAQLVAIGPDDKNTEFKISELSSLVRCGDVVWVTGQPGIGKTHTLIEIGNALLDEGKRIPLFCSLRSWAIQDQPLIAYITSSVAMKQQNVKEATLAFAIEAGHVVLLLNGWNEIPNEYQERLTVEFRDLLGQSGGATIIVSSRSMPEVTWPRVNRLWRICELSDDEIKDAVSKFELPSAQFVTTQILANWQLATMARIPLFLWELVAEAKMGHPLPSTRFTLMDRMVKRACSEHKYAIRIEGQDVAPRLLGALAIRLTDLEKTEDVVTQILPTITDVIGTLKREGELSAPPPSRSVLITLANSHLIVLEEGQTSIRFSHQLVQEFFAAKALASDLLEHGITETENRLTKWVWAVPIQMCIECLAQSGHGLLAASLVNRLVELDIEAASRAIGANPTLWESVRNSLETRIRSLSASIDVNARWLAAHCAGATGQPTFDQIVFEGLGGLPAKSGFVYAGLPIDIVFRSLGPDFTTRLLSCDDNDFRFRALTHLATPGSVEGLRLAHELAMNDSDPIIRRNAYQLLFEAGDTKSWRPFVAEVKRQGGWESGLLTVARNCSSLPIGCWRKLQLKLIQSNQDWRQRKKIYIRWATADHDGAYPHAKAEYLWCISQSKNPQVPFEDGETILHYRLYCLRVAEAIDPEWASKRAMEEVAVPGFDKLGAIPREALSDEQRATLVNNRIEHSIGSGRESLKFLATFSPETAARWILRQVSNPNFLHLQNDRRWSIKDALQQVDRLAQLKVACEAEFAQPDQSIIADLIDTLARGRGDQQIVWNASLNALWRQRLDEWLKLLPPLDHDSPAGWSNIAPLIGEVGRSEDAPLLIEMLKADETQLQRRIEERTIVVEAYRASGRRTKFPDGIDACSFQQSYHNALWELQGESVSREIAKLLSDPREVAFASHWLASHFGAPQPNESGYGSSRYRYDLIYERRDRTQAFRQSTSALLTQLKLTIDQQLAINGGKTFQGLGSSLLAVARLEGASSGTWIMDRLERYFPEGRWHELLHEILVVGAEISGRRLLPFTQSTIHDILHSDHPQNDQSWRFRQVITILFYTDAPELAIQLFNDHAQLIFRKSDYPIQLIIREILWSKSNAVDHWLQTFFDPSKSEQLRATSMEIFIDRIVDRKALDQLLEAVHQFIELGDLRRSEGAWSISSRLAKLADDHTDIQKAILRAARAAPTFEHAQRWLFLIIHIGIEESVLAAFDLTEKWGEAQMNVVSSLYPDQQTGTSVGFHGSFANWRRTFHRLPNILSRLRGMTASDDPILSHRAQRALNWIERERLGGGLGSLG